MKPPREEIEKIAHAQKLLLWSILCNIAFLTSTHVYRTALEQGPPSRSAALGYLLFTLTGFLLTAAFQITAVIRLCLSMQEGWGTVLYVVFQFVPCLNLILLLFLNGRATRRLKDAGIRVGLMGAKSRDLENYQSGGLKCRACGEIVEETAASCPMCGAML